jgi:hypothetical protein
MTEGVSPKFPRCLARWSMVRQNTEAESKLEAMALRVIADRMERAV